MEQKIQAVGGQEHNMHRPTFDKQERITSRRLIETLFGGKCSHTMAAFPLRMVYMTQQRDSTSASPVQLLISVPKKRFKHAVDRNRVKRQLREAFRLHKQLLYDSLPDGTQLLMAYVWLSDRHYATEQVNRSVVTLMQRLAGKL